MAICTHSGVCAWFEFTDGRIFFRNFKIILITQAQPFQHAINIIDDFQ